MARHLHIALQHTSDKMLSLMQRRNNFKDDIKLFEKISSYDYAIGTDFIVGHPGESQEEWDEAIKRVQELPLTHIHAFTYSKRDNTLSATMKDIVRGDIAKARHKELTSLIKAKNYEFRKQHKDGLQVLLESGKDGVFGGFDQYFNRIEVTSNQELSNNWVYLDNVEVHKDGNKAKI